MQHASGPSPVTTDVPTAAPAGPWYKRLLFWVRRDDAGVEFLYAIVLVALVLAAAAALKQPLLALIALVGLSIALALRIFWDHAFAAVSYERRLSASRAHLGDAVELELIATNKKPIPIARLDVAETVSSCTIIRDHPLRQRTAQHEMTFDTIFALGAYERSVQRYTIDCERRGWQSLGPARVRATEPFGLSSRDGSVISRDGVLVLPRLVPMLTPVIPARLPLGDAKPTVPLMEDPSRVSGVRPYIAGDSLRQINWRATARMGELQTRVHEQSADPVTMIFLDTDSTASWDSPIDDNLELRVLVAASLSRALIHDRQQVGLAANAPLVNRRQRTVVAASRQPSQLTRLLDALAEITDLQGEPITRLLTEQNPTLPWGSTLCLITKDFNATTQRVLQRIARHGAQRSCVVICVGKAPTLSVTSRRLFDVYHLDDEGVDWRVLPAISLVRLA